MTKQHIIEAIVVDEEARLTLGDLCRRCGLHGETVIAMVDEGVLEPEGRSPWEWRFPARSVSRIHTALRLQQDLGVNLAGAALVLELAEELRRLRERVRALQGEIFEKWPKE